MTQIAVAKMVGNMPEARVRISEAKARKVPSHHLRTTTDSFHIRLSSIIVLNGLQSESDAVRLSDDALQNARFDHSPDDESRWVRRIKSRDVGKVIDRDRSFIGCRYTSRHQAQRTLKEAPANAIGRPDLRVKPLIQPLLR
jgi:hypothetical protein